MNNVNSPIEVRKVIWGVILAIIWMCLFIFIKDSIVIDWKGDASDLTPLKPIVGAIGFVVIFLYHILIKAHHETKKLSATAVITIAWLSLIIFFPFRAYGHSIGSPAGAVGFFALIGGLAVVVLWVRFFSDEIAA